MQLGCGTLLYGGHSLDRALDGIQKAGYSHIELGAMPNMADHFQPGQPDSYYDEVRQKIESRGLAIESIGASSNILDAATRERFIGLMEAAAKVGAPFITTGSGGKSNDEESWAEVIRVFNEHLIPAAERTGVRLSIKPHVNHAAFNCGTALRFISELQSELVRLNYDSSHIFRAHECPVMTLRALAPYLGTARIRDMVSRDVQGPGPVETQIPGNGTMPMAAIAREYRQNPLLKVVTVEIVGAQDMDAESVDSVISRTQAALKELFA
jgi:sugar phosphate isomerase/epimerase